MADHRKNTDSLASRHCTSSNRVPSSHGSRCRFDFFTVPTVTFKILFVFIVLAHDRRRVVHFNVTEHPTARRTVQQMVEAFPRTAPPQYLILDRDNIYSADFRRRVKSLGIDEVLTAPRSPWQIPSRSGSSVQFAASALIMSSC